MEKWKNNINISHFIPDSQTGNNVAQSDEILFNWFLKFSMPGKVFKDVSFANSQTGYIVTELGAVYKTTNGGDNWTVKLNLGFPYYLIWCAGSYSGYNYYPGFNNQGDMKFHPRSS